MSDWGTFSVARDIWDHPVLSCKEPFTKREAWMWLLSAAAWKPYKHGDCGRIVSLERGEFCHSIRFLERKWDWLPGRVERFLKTLEKYDMIRDTSRDGSKVYLISKYNEYQLGAGEKRDSERDSNRDTTATPSRQDRDKVETFNHSNNKPSSLRSDGSAPKRAMRIPENFPSQAQFEAAVEFWTERGRSDLCATVADEAQNFRDHNIAKGETALDWEAKWRTWYRRTMTYNPRKPANGRAQKPTHDAVVGGGALAVAILEQRQAARDNFGAD